MRCERCATLTPDTLKLDGEPVPFHDNFAAFEAAARSGCDLCTVMFWNLQKYRWGRDERLLRYKELAKCPEPLAVRWRDLGKNVDGHIIHFLDIGYRNQNLDDRNQRVGYSILQHPSEVILPVLKSEKRLSYIERIQGWLQVCESEHKVCRANKTEQTAHYARPARLLDVLPDISGDYVRLVSFDQTNGFYAALSYAWGDRPHDATTTSHNLQDKLTSIALSGLPKTFIEAIILCRDNNVRYLWIDALCIIQPRPGDADGHQDWEAQSGTMGYIYANAIFTIAAQGAPSAEVGLFPSKAPFDLVPLSCPLFVCKAATSICLRAEPPEWVASVGESPLQQRAWVLQERLMSSRLIHFTQHCVFWECAELCASEFEPNGTDTGGLRTLSVMFSPQQGKHSATHSRGSTMLEWRSILSDYTERHLSVLTDKFPAISAIAERVGSVTSDKYIAGMWESQFVTDLLWSGLHKDPANRFRPYSHWQAVSNGKGNTYLAPSWSWASVVGKVCHEEVVNYHRLTAKLVALSVHLENSQNPFGRLAPGAYLLLASYVRHDVHITLHDTAEDQAPWADVWYTVPDSRALVNGGEASVAKHVGSGSVWFDITAVEDNRGFSAVMMTETKERAGYRDSRKFSHIVMLLARVSDTDCRYVRIGQVHLHDINFFMGCQEEVVEII